MIGTITTLGATALSQALSGSFDLEFTRCAIGTGEFDPETQNPREMTQLISRAAYLEVAAVRKEANGCAVVCDLENTISGSSSGSSSGGGMSLGTQSPTYSVVPGVTAITELGVYATVNDGEEILFAYAYDTDPEVVPSGEGTYERRFVTRFAMSPEELALTVAFETFTESFNAAIAPVLEEIDGKADAGHAHSAADITSGALPLLRGGTGASTAASARASLGAASQADLDDVEQAVADNAGAIATLRESVSLPSERKLRIEVGGSYMAVKILDASDAEKYRFVLGPTSIAYHVDNVLQWTK